MEAQSSLAPRSDSSAMALCQIIRPTALVWRYRTSVQILRSTLNHFQRLTCMEITGAMRKTLTVALKLFSSLPPVHSHMDGLNVYAVECRNLVQKVLRNGTWFGGRTTPKLPHELDAIGSNQLIWNALYEKRPLVIVCAGIETLTCCRRQRFQPTRFFKIIMKFMTFKT